MSTPTKWALIGAVLAALVFVVGAVAADAFWATSSGSRTAAVGTTRDNLAIASPPVTGVTPGSSAPVTVTVTNPNSYSVHVNTVSTSITTSDPGCLPADFTFPAKVLDSTLPPLGKARFTENLAFADTAANQQACKGATITLTYAST